MPVCLDVLAQGAWIGVALQAARHLAVIRLVYVVGAGVLESVAGVGVTLAAAFVRADVGFLSYPRHTQTIISTFVLQDRSPGPGC